MKLDTQEMVNRTLKRGIAQAQSLGIDANEDDYTICQPFSNGHNIIVRIVTEDSGDRTIKVDVSDGLILLPEIEGTLDVFKDSEVTN
ncbi:MAG: 2-hydroxyacyl-CoA dehydratase [Streptococcaceae bacterium]|jgi:hypothetical protein|nr:2-hydroxyacyl-CoA dehydratase [Streptococcaceae bacterium]